MQSRLPSVPSPDKPATLAAHFRRLVQDTQHKGHRGLQVGRGQEVR